MKASPFPTGAIHTPRCSLKVAALGLDASGNEQQLAAQLRTRRDQVREQIRTHLDQQRIDSEAIGDPFRTGRFGAGIQADHKMLTQVPVTTLTALRPAQPGNLGNEGKEGTNAPAPLTKSGGSAVDAALHWAAESAGHHSATEGTRFAQEAERARRWWEGNIGAGPHHHPTPSRMDGRQGARQAATPSASNDDPPSVASGKGSSAFMTYGAPAPSAEKRRAGVRGDGAGNSQQPPAASHAAAPALLGSRYSRYGGWQPH